MNICPYCDGEGENMDMARCMDCDGTGFLEEVEHDDGECFYCNGTGIDELDEMGVCKPCHGKGVDFAQSAIEPNEQPSPTGTAAES